MTDEIEMADYDRPDVEDTSANNETEIDLPDVPMDIQDAQAELVKTNFISDVRKSLNIRGNIDPAVYRRLTFDTEGQLMYNHKRLTFKQGSKLKLYSLKTLARNPNSREFLKMIGYLSEESQSQSQSQLAPTERISQRDLDTVAPEQTTVIKSKMDGFKATEEWAKREKEKATRQLEQTTSESERQKLQQSVQYFDQMEIQARRRYNEVMQNQFKRINTIINDETKPLSERLKELFRRDGLTIGALITAVGMTISTIVLAVLPHNTAPPGPGDSYIDRVKAAVKKSLVKLSNVLLDLAKKALTALPGIIGSVVSFILKKAGQAVLFLSEHMILFLIAIVLAAYEVIVKTVKYRKTPTT